MTQPHGWLIKNELPTSWMLQKTDRSEIGENTRGKWNDISDKTGPTNTNGLYHYFFLSFLSSLIQAKNRFANNGTANFS